jgi:hypothetical protein
MLLRLSVRRAYSASGRIHTQPALFEQLARQETALKGFTESVAI